jgi:hypothetical protein
VGRIAQISWITVRGIAELAIMVYVLNAISDPSINLIVALLGIIYASIRNATLFLHLLIARLAWSGDIQFLEHKRVWADQAADIDTETADTDTSMSRVLVNYYIAGTFIGLQYLCLLYVFSNLPMMVNTE